MKKQMRRWLAVGIAAVMVLQAVHVENYGSLRQVFAAPESKTQMSTGEIAEPDTSVTTELETGNSIEEAETAENAAAEMLEEAAAATSMDGEELQDLSVENGLIEGDYSISVPSRLTGNLVIEGNLNVNQPITLNGYSLVVEGDIIQNRDLVVNGDLIVYGNYQWRDGSLTLEKGYVNIEADMQIFYANGKILSMRQEEDYLLIKGDMLLEASNGLGTDITAGTLELRGDFTQKVYTNGGRMGLPEGDFLMTGNSILLLSGEGRQNIYVSKETSGFEHITVSTANLEKDEEEKYIFGERQIGFSGFYNFKTYEDNGCPTTYGCAEYDEISEEENVIYGSCYYTGELLHLKKRNLTFTGDFIQNADVCLEGGRLEIYGDYRIQSVQGKEQFGETEGIIDCSGGGYVYVYGDFVTQSLADHTGYLDAGTWYFYSNLCQIGKNAKNFVTSDSFKIYWNYVTGESEERHIIMDNPLENPIVYLYNYTKDDFVFDNGVCIDQFLCGRPYSGMLYLRTDKAAGTYQGDVTIVSPAALTSYLTVEGNLTVQADVTVQTLVTVKKNVDVEHGVLTFESGAALDAGNVSFTDGSDSALRMEKEAAYIRCDNFYYGSNCSSESLTNGEINVTDDFYVKDTGTPDSFVCSENHRVVASGSNGVQTITIESPESCLETLVVSNGNGGMTRSTEGTVIHSIQNKSYSYMWEGIEGYTLEQDVVYDGDLILCGGVLDLNGHTLTVKGDFYAEGGTIHVNGGHLIVNGSLKCVYRDWADGEIRLERSNVDIIMDNDNDRMDVTGDWYAIFITHSLKNMTAGTVHLSGNMNIEGSVGSDYASAVETILNGSSLWLEGTEKQSVTGISKNIQMKINDLVVTNEKEIEIELPLQIDGMLQLPENLKYQFYELTIQNLDNLSGRIFKGNLTAKQSTLSGDVTIDGNLSIKGKTDLCGYHISAKEITVDAETTLSGGGLHVDTLYMNHKIIMQNPADVIEAKDMNVQVKISDSDYMTDGNIYITGDFKDISSYYSNSQQTYAFLPTENHTITFMKPDSTTENKASITFYGQASKLNRVILENKLNCYTLNREKEDIANELILNYEDNEKPTSPQNITCTRKNCYSVDLKWEESEDNMEVYRYKIYRNGQYIGKTGDNAYTDAILKSNMNYRYSLTAVDGAGNESDMSQVLEVATPDDENAPDYSNAPEFEVKGDSVSINCNNTYADKENYVDYYIITRDGEDVARVLENSYVSYKNYKNETITKCVHLGRPYYSETGLEYGKNYTYGIAAVDAAGNRSEEYVKNVTADLPPAAPEQFLVVSENGYNTISFEKSGNPGCSSYKLYRGGTCITTFTNNSNVTAYYVDKNVKAGCSYQYYIVPYNKYGTEGEKTETFSVITIADKTPPVIENVSYSIPGDIFNEEVDICVTASDNSGISSIYAYLEKEGEENTEIYRVTFGEYAASCSEEFTLAVDGRKGIYDLHVVAVDHCGNETEEVKACRIQIAGIAPVKALPVETDAASVSLSWEPVEEAAYYVVEQKTGSTYERVGRTSAGSLTVSQLECDRKYSFRIAAYDKDGVRGLATDDITAVTLPDTTNPAISKVYGNDSIFGISSLLEIGYWDDHKVKKVSAFYRPKGTSDWILIGEQQVNRRTGTCYMSWDKTGLKSEGYDVLYQAEDSSGNLSEELILTYTLDLEGPVLNNLSLIPKDWAIRLEWDEIKDADYSGFRIQRVTKSQYDTAMEQGQDPFQNAAVIKQGSKNHFFEEEISPKEEYVYQLSLYDGYGNVTTSTVSGQAVDNDVKSPEMDGLQPLFAARDVAVSLSAGECRDNDGIASYQWDMGNGDIIYGANCEYTYKKIGCYQLTLTVLDPSGNSSSSTTTVTVGEDIGTVKVTVMSEGKALPDADVVLCMNSQPCHSGVEPQTNSQGKLTMPVSEGTYQIAAYKAGYVPASEEITVTAGETKEVIICLKKGDSIQASFTTKEMTFEEMKKAGIDTEANKVVFQYNINLEFEKGKIGSMTMNSTKPVVTCYLSGGTFNPLPGDSEDDKDDKDDNKTSITVQNISDDPSKPVFTLTQIKPVEISWLKNIYEVEVTIINQAEEEFRLEDAKARLNLPDGLELANMKNEKKIVAAGKLAL